MEKLIIKLMVTVLISLFSLSLQGQYLSDKEAIVQSLSGRKLSGKFSWRPKDRELKKLARGIILDRITPITNDGIKLVSFILTGDEYDDENDSFFLNTLIDFLDIQTLIKAKFITDHFKRTLYSNKSRDKLSALVNSKEILKWQKYIPYYLSFLEVDGIDSTLLFLKQNIDAINHLHFALYNDPYRFDTLDVNVCLARLGKLSDTIVTKQIEDDLSSNWRKDYEEYFERLARIRTPYAFQKIGGFLDIKLITTKSKEDQEYISQLALAAFLVYVKNFPDRSTKIQETIDLWRLVEFSRFYGKDYSTNEYMEKAKSWYLENKDNLILDYDKY